MTHGISGQRLSSAEISMLARNSAEMNTFAVPVRAVPTRPVPSESTLNAVHFVIAIVGMAALFVVVAVWHTAGLFDAFEQAAALEFVG